MEIIINTHLEEFERIYYKLSSNSINDQKKFKIIFSSIKKCLKLEANQRPNFKELFQENMKNSISQEKIKFLIDVLEKPEVSIEKQVMRNKDEEITMMKKQIEKLENEKMLLFDQNCIMKEKISNIQK